MPCCVKSFLASSPLSSPLFFSLSCLLSCLVLSCLLSCLSCLVLSLIFFLSCLVLSCLLSLSCLVSMYTGILFIDKTEQGKTSCRDKPRERKAGEKDRDDRTRTRRQSLSSVLLPAFLAQRFAHTAFCSAFCSQRIYAHPCLGIFMHLIFFFEDSI
jgi:hypothetical protein